MLGATILDDLGSRLHEPSSDQGQRLEPRKETHMGPATPIGKDVGIPKKAAAYITEARRFKGPRDPAERTPADKKPKERDITRYTTSHHCTPDGVAKGGEEIWEQHLQRRLTGQAPRRTLTSITSDYQDQLAITVKEQHAKDLPAIEPHEFAYWQDYWTPRTPTTKHRRPPSAAADWQQSWNQPKKGNSWLGTFNRAEN